MRGLLCALLVVAVASLKAPRDDSDPFFDSIAPVKETAPVAEARAAVPAPRLALDLAQEDTARHASSLDPYEVQMLQDDGGLSLAADEEEEDDTVPNLNAMETGQDNVTQKAAGLTPSRKKRKREEVTPSESATISVSASPSVSIPPTASTTPSKSPVSSRSPSTSRSASISKSPAASTSPSRSLSPSVSLTMTSSVTPSTTKTPSASRPPSQTPSVSLSAVPSITSSPSVTPKPSPPNSRSPSMSLSPPPSPSPTRSFSASPTISTTPTQSVSQTMTATHSLSPSMSVSQGPTWSGSTSFSPSPSLSSDPSKTPTISVSNSLSASASFTPSISFSPTPSFTPSNSPSPTPSPYPLPPLPTRAVIAAVPSVEPYLPHPLERSMYAEETKAVWNYDESSDKGPESWYSLDKTYATCAENSPAQSPLDLFTFRVASPMSPLLTPLYKAGLMLVRNTGNYIRLVPHRGSVLYWGDKIFDLVYASIRTPSEHHMGGETFPVEVQFVHKSQDDDQLAVLALLYKQGLENTFIERVLEVAPTQFGKEEMLGGAINLGDAVPRDITQYKAGTRISYPHYTYDGSLTTPPCTENVRWFIWSKPDHISKSQIDRLRRLAKGANAARPLQNVNGRVVEYKTLF